MTRPRMKPSFPGYQAQGRIRILEGMHFRRSHYGVSTWQESLFSEEAIQRQVCHVRGALITVGPYHEGPWGYSSPSPNLMRL